MSSEIKQLLDPSSGNRLKEALWASLNWFRSPHSITWHLASFAIALAAPFLLLAAYVGWSYVQQERYRFEDQSLRLVQEVASRIDNDLASFRATLDVLASSPSLTGGDFQQFYDYVSNRPLGGGDGWLVVRDRHGKVVINTRVPFGETLPNFAHPEMDRAIFDQTKPFVSNVFLGPRTRRWVVNLASPVVSPNGAVDHAIQLVIPAEYFEQLLKEVQTSPGWILTINDRQGKILARSYRHAEVVGEPMVPQGWELTKDVPRGQGGVWHNLRNLEGGEVRGGYYRMISTGWLIGAAALPNVYDAPRRQAMVLGGGMSVLVLASSVILATFFGRRLVRAIEVLRREARALEQGIASQLGPTPLQEVNDVAQIMRETTDVLRRRQEGQEILLQELNHRVKNTLATVQSLARRTFRGDPTGRYERFEGRLLSLSNTHNLLTASEWQGANIHDIVDSELAPYKDQVRWQGSSCFLPTRVALSLSMILHELGTNAAKYGAFSLPQGKVFITWHVTEDLLDLQWVERGGPPVSAPQSQGFGSILIAHTIERELQGKFTAHYLSTGFCGDLQIPLSDALTCRAVA